MFDGRNAPEANGPNHLSLMRILCICMSTLGTEIAFNVLYSLSEPIMEKLNMPSNAMFACWLAGPLAGLTTLPLIGAWSDKSKSKLGRRRPFLIGGCVFTMIGFALLYLLQIYGPQFSPTVLAVSMFFVLFLNYAAINTLCSPSRAIIGDIIPAEQQELANAIASVLIGISSVLPNIVGGLGYFIKNTKYADMADQITLIFCIVTVLLCVILTCFTTHEKTYTKIEAHKSNPIKDIVKALKEMPKPVSRACVLIFLSWVANYMYTMMGTDYFMDEVFPKEESSKGLCFGMLVIASSNALAFIYGCFHVSLSECIGYRTTYVIAHIIEALSLVSVFFFKSPWILFACLTPIGFSIANFNSTPYSIAALSASDSNMGIYMSILSACIDFAYLFADIVMNLVGSYVFEYFNKDSWKVERIQSLIGASSVFAVLTAFYCFFVIIPDKSQYVAIVDNEIIPENDIIIYSNKVNSVDGLSTRSEV